MVTKADLAGLEAYKLSSGPVLSIYLDVDQSKPANRNRGFEACLAGELRGLTAKCADECEIRDFEASAGRVTDFVSKYVPNAHSLVIFAQSTGSLWARELSVPTKTQVWWQGAAHIQPLVEAMDEYQRHAVVLVDRQQARIFTVQLGKIEKHADIQSAGRVRHVKTAGRDHLFSQSGFQRRADAHVHSHLKRVVEVLEDVARSRPFERLILVGTSETTSELARMLPKWLYSRLVGSITLSINATDAEILSAVEQLEHAAERSFEVAQVDELLDGNLASTIVADTLRAINERRVRQFVYSEGSPIPGGRCRICGSVYDSSAINCDYCGVPVEPVDDVIEPATTRALASGASIEELRGEAAERLNAKGGLGAFLRY
jgi:peptide subunit release factor 1 (eRF1)